MSAPITKPGRYGTLYRFKIQYTAGEGSPVFLWRTWAYDAEHAWEKWHDCNAFEPGWEYETHGTFVVDTQHD